VTQDLKKEAQEKGDTIEIPIIDTATVVDVAPAADVPTAVTVQPTKVQLALDWWKEVSFTLQDDEVQEIIDGVVPLRAGAAFAALGNAASVKVLSNYVDVYDSGGVAGTTPMASTATAFLDARLRLNANECPVDGRNVVLDADGEGTALGLPQFYQAHMAGDQEGIKQGQIGHKYGCDWYMDQNVQTHDGGCAWGSFATLLVCTAAATGATSIELRSTSSGPTLVAGDIFHLSTDDANQNYVVYTGIATTGTVVTVQVVPALRKSYATTVAVTGWASHVANLLFHPGAFAFASRPVVGGGFGSGQLGPQFFAAKDPISGIALSVEVSRQHYQTRWAWSILAGSVTVRPELAARILG
jgi:hypothetical protein